MGNAVSTWDAAFSAASAPRPARAEAIVFTTDHQLAVRERRDLCLHEGGVLKRAAALEKKMLRLFGRSLKFRQVSAGGCNACEADINVLTTIGFDLGRFGIQIVASPRHADGLLVTGPVTRNMALALQKTYAAVPAPRLIVAVRRLRHLGRALRRSSRPEQRRAPRDSGRPLHPRLSAAPHHDPGWISAPVEQDRLSPASANQLQQAVGKGTGWVFRSATASSRNGEEETRSPARSTWAPRFRSISGLPQAIDIGAVQGDDTSTAFFQKERNDEHSKGTPSMMRLPL